VCEAEDVVQEELPALPPDARGRRTHRVAARLRVEELSRLSLAQLRSARVQRETYVGEWLPKPLVAHAAHGPAREAEMADSLSLAFLVLLKRLSHEERAAFRLREVLDEPYDRIAELVGTRQNARQLATPARRHLERRPRFEVSREQRAEFATASLGRRMARSRRAEGAAGPRRRLPRRRRLISALARTLVRR
jgi:DNA-directed RNA polymerase specialized sigma24 family protein